MTTLKPVSISSQNEQFGAIIKVAEKISIQTNDSDLVSIIKSANTFPNPKYLSNEQHGYSNRDTDSTISTYHHEGGSLILPRGFLRDLQKILDDRDITPQILDERATNPCVYPEKLEGITLRPYQQRAVDSAMEFDEGIVISPTGSGKTLIGLEIIRQKGQKALIIVHRGDLAKQWIDVIKERLGIKACFIGDGCWEVGDVTVAMIQTISSSENETKALSGAFGTVLLDEAHHAPATNCFWILGRLAAKYRYGLSAISNRRDGLEPMIYRAIGPVISTITKKEVESLGATVPTTVVSIETGFNPGVVNSWNEYLDAISVSPERNEGIIQLAQRSEGSILILTDRVDHAEKLSQILGKRNIDHVLAHGQINKKERQDLMERIKAARITVGTTGLLGEGLDVTSWSVLIMASPISSEIKLMQAVGRIVRSAPGKEKAIAYDLKDDCGFSGSSFKKRFEIYKKHRIWVQFGRRD
jgi:superfamily II DNA or RNA helicase